MRHKFVSKIGIFRDLTYYNNGWRGFEKSEPSAFYSLAYFLAAPFLPLATYFGYKAFGVDAGNAYPFVDSRQKHLYFNEKQNGNDDVGAVFEYHYDDGSKEVSFTKK